MVATTSFVDGSMRVSVLSQKLMIQTLPYPTASPEGAPTCTDATTLPDSGLKRITLPTLFRPHRRSHDRTHSPGTGGGAACTALLGVAGSLPALSGDVPNRSVPNMPPTRAALRARLRTIAPRRRFRSRLRTR
jgi:hypothetical protein